MGVRLFDRSTQGVVPTQYGDLLVKRAVEAFDAPKQGLRSIEFASCPGAGDAWVGFGKLAWYGLMPTVIQQLAREHLKIIVHAAPVNPSGNTLQHLSDRHMDLIIGRNAHTQADGDLLVETLYEDSFSIVVSAQSPWANRDQVERSELMNESWIYGKATNLTQMRISAVFRAKVGGLPRIAMYTTAMNFLLQLLATGDYISCIPTSTYRYGNQRESLKAPPIDMGLRLPFGIFRLKNRTLKPAAELFIATAHEVGKTMAADGYKIHHAGPPVASQISVTSLTEQFRMAINLTSFSDEAIVRGAGTLEAQLTQIATAQLMDTIAKASAACRQIAPLKAKVGTLRDALYKGDFRSRARKA